MVEETSRDKEMNNMERIADITIRTSEFGTGDIVMDQDEDRILVRREDIEEFVAAIGRYGEGKEPTPEKWYVVLTGTKNRRTDYVGEPMVFTTFWKAWRVARTVGGVEGFFFPIRVDDYEMVARR